MSTERWLPVVGFEGLYEVSDLGRVRSIDRIVGEGEGRGGRRPAYGRVIRRQYRPDGYACLCLHRGGRSYPRLVHRLVLEAFKGLRPGKQQAAHRDGVKKNCAAANLRWKTPKANSADRVRHGTALRGSASPTAKLTEAKVRQIRHMAALGVIRRLIAQKFRVGEPAVDKIVWRQRWKHI